MGNFVHLAGPYLAFYRRKGGGTSCRRQLRATFTHYTVVDLGFEKGCFLYGGQSPPGHEAAHPRGVWGHAPQEKLTVLRCILAHSGRASGQPFYAAAVQLASDELTQPYSSLLEPSACPRSMLRRVLAG